MFKISLNTAIPASSRSSIAKKWEQVKTTSTHIMYTFSEPQHTKTQQAQARISCIRLVNHSTLKRNKHKHTYYVIV